MTNQILDNMDYSELVYAIQRGDMQTANKLCAKATVILKKYLVSKLDASNSDAEDAVQRMFEYVIPKIQNDEIENPTGLLSYMLTGARHSYLKIANKESMDDYEEYSDNFISEADQAWILINEERQRILEKCVEGLKDSYRSLAKFIFQYPDAEGDEIAEKFEITTNNAWIRKHRVLKKLTDCVQSIS